MKVKDWQQVKDIFYAALTKPLAERESFLAVACGRDASLRSEIEVLLESYESGFLEKPIVDQLIPKRRQADPHFGEGDEFSHYRVVKLLGRGGMGEVYLVKDTALDRNTAIKMIHSESGLGDQSAIRLLREARAAAKLEHPNICSVYEVGETEGIPFIAMQFVEGRTLDDLLRTGDVTFGPALNYARQIAAALHHAHSASIVHGDIKPSNLIIDGAGNLRVLDFGLAKEVKGEPTAEHVTASGPVAGTIAYMSPEQLRGEEIDRRADVWSLGVVFYQMLTGRQPFSGATRADLISGIQTCDFQRPDGIPRRHAAIVNKILSRALVKDRSKRYSSVLEMDADLAAAAAEPTALAWKYRTIGAAVLFLIVISIILVWQRGGFASSNTNILQASAGAMRIENLFDKKRRAGGAITDLTFSPDGETLAFTLADEGPIAIFTLPRSGGKAARLTKREVDESSPIWSPDGSQIAFLSTEKDDRKMIFAVPREGGSAVPLVELNDTPGTTTLKKWSNDGRSVFFDDGEGAKAIELASGRITSLPLDSVDGKVGGFALSADEKNMLAVSSANGLEQLWLKDLSSGKAQLISESSPRNGVPSWFPANAGFAYSADDNGSFHIYTRPIDGSEPRQITFGNFTATHPVVAPDGRRLAYVSNLDEANIFHYDITTGSQSSVTNNVNLQLFPALSPDGRHIAYQSSNETSKITSGVLKIEALPNSSSDTVSLPDRGCCLKWSPDGREVAYIRRTGSSFELYRTNVANPLEVAVTSGGILMAGFALSPFELEFLPYNWGPDGGSIVFTSKRSGKHNVWSVRSDGSAEMLTNFDGTSRPTTPMYSPDGQSVAFVEAVGTGPPATAKRNRIVIWDGVTTKVLNEFESGISLLGWNRSGESVFVATSDGKIIALSAALSASKNSRLIAVLADARRQSIRLSPDRNWAAYTVTRNGADNLCTRSIGADRERCLTTNDDPTVFYSGIAWSPDSKGLYFSKQTGGMQISLISLQ